MKTFSEYLAEATKSPGTYACLKVSAESKDELRDWLEENEIGGMIDPEEDEYHCTIIYSKKAVPQVEDLDPNLPITAKVKGWEVFGDDKILVALLTSKDIVKLNKEAMEMGATSDFDSYVPHVSVATGWDGDVPNSYPKFSIEFDKYDVTELDVDFEYNAKDKDEDED